MSKHTNKTFQFELVSPECVLLSEEASMVIIPGGAGDFGVLAEHAPVLSSVRTGVLSLHTPSGDVKKIFVTGGFADVSHSLCSVLAEEATNIEDFNKADLEESLKNLKEDLEFSKDDKVKFAHIEKEINLTEEKLKAVA